MPLYTRRHDAPFDDAMPLPPLRYDARFYASFIISRASFADAAAYY